jgi:hypothetical protein
VPALIVNAVFVLIGLSALSEPWREVGIGGAIVAILSGVAGWVGAVCVLAINVTLTPAEITYRHNFRRPLILCERRRWIPWPSVDAFRVGIAPGWLRWSCVVVELRSAGSVRRPVAGTRRHVCRVIAYFEAYRARLDAEPLTTS